MRPTTSTFTTATLRAWPGSSSGVGEPGELRRVDRDVDRLAGRDDLVAVPAFGGDEQLASFPVDEPGPHLEGFVDGHGRVVAHRELTGERRLPELADDVARHVVEHGRDDAAV